MRYFCLFKPDTTSPPPTPERVAAINKYIADSYADGSLITTDGFAPSPKDVRVRLAGGKLTVTDGPFVEAKELVGGYAIMEASSREEIIAMTKRFLELVGGGESEVHELAASPAGQKPR
ncbi:MAG: YciI family protein [Polyangiaceae bacterium]